MLPLLGKKPLSDFSFPVLIVDWLLEVVEVVVNINTVIETKSEWNPKYFLS